MLSVKGSQGQLPSGNCPLPSVNPTLQRLGHRCLNQLRELGGSAHPENMHIRDWLFLSSASPPVRVHCQGTSERSESVADLFPHVNGTNFAVSSSVYLSFDVSPTK